jgi:nucleoside-diphosphate-sugar epimerase
MSANFNIYLTGSTGFLGSVIKDVLQNSLDVGSLEINQSDLTKSMPEFVKSYDIVIHCAGKAHFKPRNKDEKEKFDEVNFRGTKNLLKSLEKMPPKMFVFISSVSVYGINSGIQIDESYPLAARDAYGVSKVNAEKAIIDWCENRNVKYSILRLPLVVAKNPPGNLGAMINGIKNKLYFNIAGGNANKSMVFASDIASFILKIAIIGGIYNLTDRRHPSFYSLSNLIARQLGVNYIFNIPFWIAYLLGKIGDFFGPNFIITSEKVIKITSTLTFNDDLAVKKFGWAPNSITEKFKIN